MADLKAIKCPTCSRRGAWFDGEFGPFCSKRCRLIDLGQWFSEEHKISDPLPDTPESDDNLPTS
jgi:uncharacterized protein